MNFVAIDFETANEKRTSACSIGIVEVEDGKIVNSEHIFFKPFPNYFTNTWIHGIAEDDVVNELSFSEKWDTIRHYFEDRLIVAHNASFDLSVLRQILSESEIEFPKVKYACTYRLSEKVISDLPNYKLSTLAKHFGFELKHHEALSDSIVCAKIGVELLNIKNHSCLIELSKEEGFQIGKLKSDFKYIPFSKKQKRPSIYSCKKISTFEVSKKSEILKGEKIVVSGVFSQFSRVEIKKMVIEHGGKNVSSISKNTTFVLAGDNMGPSKKQKAEDLKIPLVNETEFLEKIS